MAFVTSQEAIDELRLGEAADEPALARYIAAASEAAALYMDRSIYATQEALDAAKAAAEDDGVEFDEYAMVVNDSIKTAILVIVGTMSRRDNADWDGRMPFAARMYLDPLRARLGL